MNIPDSGNMSRSHSLCPRTWSWLLIKEVAIWIQVKIQIFTETADAEARGAGPRGGAAQLDTLVAGVARPVGPRRGRSAGFIFEGHDCEQGQNWTGAKH